MISRRGLLGAIICAPAIIRTPGLLMPIKVLRPETMEFEVISVTEDRDGKFRHELRQYQKDMLNMIAACQFSMGMPMRPGDRITLSDGIVVKLDMT